MQSIKPRQCCRVHCLPAPTLPELDLTTKTCPAQASLPIIPRNVLPSPPPPRPGRLAAGRRPPSPHRQGPGAEIHHPRRRRGAHGHPRAQRAQRRRARRRHAHLTLHHPPLLPGHAHPAGRNPGAPPANRLGRHGRSRRHHGGQGRRPPGSLRHRHPNGLRRPQGRPPPARARTPHPAARPRNPGRPAPPHPGQPAGRHGRRDRPGPARRAGRRREPRRRHPLRPQSRDHALDPAPRLARARGRGGRPAAAPPFTTGPNRASILP